MADGGGLKKNMHFPSRRSRLLRLRQLLWLRQILRLEVGGNVASFSGFAVSSGVAVGHGAHGVRGVRCGIRCGATAAAAARPCVRDAGGAACWTGVAAAVSGAC